MYGDVHSHTKLLNTSTLLNGMKANVSGRFRSTGLQLLTSKSDRSEIVWKKNEAQYCHIITHITQIMSHHVLLSCFSKKSGYSEAWLTAVTWLTAHDRRPAHACMCPDRLCLSVCHLSSVMLCCYWISQTCWRRLIGCCSHIYQLSLGL